MRRLLFTVVAATATLVLSPGTAVADANNESGTFELHLEQPNVAEASNGDRVSVTGSGVFSVHPKSVTASGGFTHTNSQGAVIGSGSWTASGLLSFEFYGCGVVPAIGATLPPNFCGGALKLRVVLTPSGTTLAIPGVLTIFCVVGPQAPPTHDNPTEPGEEGIHLVVPGVANFNQIVSGMNIYIQTA
jgi:hypothetical protein